MGNSGRPLNGLDFPRVTGSPSDLRLATDLYAHQHIIKKKAVQFGYPLDFTRWSLLSTAHTSSNWHIDAGGAGTHIKVVVGCKIWFVVRFTEENLDLLYLKDVDITEAINKGWEIEYVVLTPGCEL